MSERLDYRRIVLFAFGLCAILYVVAVLLCVSASSEIGVKSILSPYVIGTPTCFVRNPGDELPVDKDRITKVGGVTITTWRDLLEAPEKAYAALEHSGGISEPSGQILIPIEFQRPDDSTSTVRHSWTELRGLPLEEMIPSVIWLFLKGSLFVIGAFVYWKRPNDEAAIRFYILCVMTLGAYIGGYHWTQIVTEPLLMVVFMACAIFLPVASLHFYLVFPRPKAWLEQYPYRTQAAIYGIPFVNFLGMVGYYFYIRWFADQDSLARDYLPWAIYLSIGMAAAWYLLCMAALTHSLRTVQDPMERKQIKCIMVGVFFSHFPIGHSLYIVLAEPERFVEGAVTWPMFIASLIVTLAFAIGMTRYRLLELGTIINSSMGYFLVSFLAGLLYYGVVFISTLFFNRFISSPTLPTALMVSTMALLLVLILDAARNRIQKALDRRFSQQKTQIDQTLQQMSQAVSQLVDPSALAQRLLTTVADTINIPAGAIYLRRQDGPRFSAAARRGQMAALEEVADDAPLVQAMSSGTGLACVESDDVPESPAQAQLRNLGGEVAQPLLSDGALMAFLVLGPKDTPYRADDWHLLSAFAQITSVALESAAKHRAIDSLNQELQAKVDKIAEQQRRILTLQSQLKRTSLEPPPKPATKPETEDPMPSVNGIVGSSPALRQLLTLVRKVAAADAVVLLRGESGTGKELLARALHESSARAAKPYVKVHCAALSANLLESELFGHVKGAFTGAHRDKVGRFELANGGTLFLDEIGDISLDVQTKLLRVLQEKTIERVGSSESMNVDVRIVAATHQNLEELIRQGRFREDLFYRLNVFPIVVPALRERVEDIPELAMYFIQQSAQRARKKTAQIDDDSLSLLKSFPWPGNIRQLENAIERAVVMAEGEVLTLHDMPPELFQARPELPMHAETNGEAETPAVVSTFRSERDRFEREKIKRALDQARGNKSEAARALGIARTTLVSRMKKLGLE